MLAALAAAALLPVTGVAAADPTTPADPTTSAPSPTSATPSVPSPTSAASPASATPSVPQTTMDHAGTYAVGTDIVAGTYASAGPVEGDKCYWKRVGGDDGNTTLDNALTGKAQVVEIQPTDKAFKTNGCQPWQLTDAPRRARTRRGCRRSSCTTISTSSTGLPPNPETGSCRPPEVSVRADAPVQHP